MDNTLMTIIGIFLLAVLIFVVPLMSITERNDDITQTVVQTATAEFVDKISVSGVIKPSAYEEYEQKLASTGNTYEIEIEVQHLDENFGKKSGTTSADLIGENERYSTFTTEILENMYTSDGTTQNYVLKKGDNVIVTAKNTNKTTAQTLRTFVYKITGQGTNQIDAVSSSMVINDGNGMNVINTEGVETNGVVVTFNPNGGTCETQNREVTFGGTYGDLPTAEREGYTFTGWYTAPTGGAKVEGTTMVDTIGNHTLYAQWSINVYVVTYNSNGGNDAPSAQTKKHGENLILTNEIPNKPGYTFNGWKDEYTDTIYQPGATFTRNENVILYAEWTASTYTVTFNPNGGTCEIQNKEVTFGEAYSDLPTPERNGYTFTGWYTAPTEGTKVEETTIVEVTGNHTLYAHWTTNTSIVIFNPNGGECEIQSQLVIVGDKYGELPTPTKVGYDFTGWYTEETGGTEVKETTLVTTKENHTLYAHWEESKYTVTFNPNGGSCSTLSKIVTHGKEYGNLPVAEREGYTFAGWYTAQTGGVKVEEETIVIGSHTLYAHWFYTVDLNIELDGELVINDFGGITVDVNLEGFEFENDVQDFWKDSCVPYGSKLNITDIKYDENIYTYKGIKIIRGNRDNEPDEVKDADTTILENLMITDNVYVHLIFETKSVYLYQKGNEYTDLTGGWESCIASDFVFQKELYTGAYYEKKSNNLSTGDLETGAYGNGAFITLDKINLDEYDKIVVKFKVTESTEAGATNKVILELGKKLPPLVTYKDSSTLTSSNTNITHQIRNSNGTYSNVTYKKLGGYPDYYLTQNKDSEKPNYNSAKDCYFGWDYYAGDDHPSNTVRSLCDPIGEGEYNIWTSTNDSTGVEYTREVILTDSMKNDIKNNGGCHVLLSTHSHSGTSGTMKAEIYEVYLKKVNIPQPDAIYSTTTNFSTDNQYRILSKSPQNGRSKCRWKRFNDIICKIYSTSITNSRTWWKKISNSWM